MKISQKLYHINENSYDDTITITNISKGYFPAVTHMSIIAGSTTREIRIELLPLEQARGGEVDVTSGLFVRKADEKEVKVTVSKDGKELVSDTTSYS